VRFVATHTGRIISTEQKAREKRERNEEGTVDPLSGFLSHRQRARLLSPPTTKLSSPLLLLFCHANGAFTLVGSHPSRRVVVLLTPQPGHIGIYAPPQTGERQTERERRRRRRRQPTCHTTQLSGKEGRWSSIRDFDGAYHHSSSSPH